MTYWVKSASGDWEGPVSVEVLQSWIGTGELQRDTLLRKDGEDTMEAAFLNPLLRFPKNPPRPVRSVSSPDRNPAIRDERLRQFNWGAFMFTWLWGIHHRKHILLLLIPLGLMFSATPAASVAFFAVDVWIGMQGNQWAWESERFATLEDMVACEEAWHRAAMWALGIGLILFVLIGLWITTLPTEKPKPTRIHPVVTGFAPSYEGR